MIRLSYAEGASRFGRYGSRDALQQEAPERMHNLGEWRLGYYHRFRFFGGKYGVGAS